MILSDKMQKEFNFLFSIIIPIYNGDRYIEEAVNSVIKQTIGFKNNIQLILVNDGSEDSTEEICLKIKNKYKNNVVYLYQENKGVNSARNKGLDLAKGKYINFLDVDDKLSKNALKKVYNFFEKHYDEIDLVSIPMQFFENSEKEHYLNEKFENNGTSIIDITNEREIYLQDSVPSSFIKKDIFDKFKFNELNLIEDKSFINKVILEKSKYGIVDSCKYYFRSRETKNTLLQENRKCKEFYTYNLKECYIHLINYSLKKSNNLPKYIQKFILNNIRYQIRTRDVYNNILSSEESEEYRKTLSDILNYINDEIINDDELMNPFYRLFLFELKYKNEKLNCKISENNIHLEFKDNLIDSITDRHLSLDIVEINNKGKLKISGHFLSIFGDKNIEILAINNDNEIKAKNIRTTYFDIYSLDHLIRPIYGFEVEIPLDESNNIYFKVNIKGKQQEIIFNNLNWSPMNGVKNTYYSENGFLMNCSDHVINEKAPRLILWKNISIAPYSFYKSLKLQTKFLLSILSLRKKGFIKGFLFNLVFFYVKLFNKERIWLFSDRIDKADDNGEHIFKYAVNKNEEIKKYFVISKHSSDFEKMNKIGNTVNYGSYHHKILLLLAEKVVSSHTEKPYNPFGGTKKFYVGNMTADHIFIQHGIIIHDVSNQLGKLRQNIKFFVTTTKGEYDSITKGNYNYDSNIVKLTGLARHDNLTNKLENIIAITPTWQVDLVAKPNPDGTRPYSEKFKDTKFFKGWDDLLNDERLVKSARKLGYKLLFRPHPTMYQQISDFDTNDILKIPKMESSYQELFNKSKLMITDYSSVALDFGYLKKSVLYYQFDEEGFHYSHGYFDYSRDGFGEVVSKKDELVDLLIEYMENDCKVKDKYKKRLDKFYSYNDKNNCKRVYDAILEQDKKE